MLSINEQAPSFSLFDLDGNAREYAGLDKKSKPALLIFFETDCPTCRLTFPYLNKLTKAISPDSAEILGISQDNETATREFVRQMETAFPILLDGNLAVTRQYDPLAVPTLFLVDAAGKVALTEIAFDKAELNAIAAKFCEMIGVETIVIAEEFDGAPKSKPGCTSRHLEGESSGVEASPVDLYSQRGRRASRIELGDDVDPFEYCLRFDHLPVVPPTVERVERMLRAAKLPPEEIIARIPPNYGEATVEKIAANAVMAGCQPEMMRVLIPLIRAVCDERFNLHGVQATTHFAAPMIVINGPIRHELGFVCGSNVLSNVARANSTLGRAFQLIITNIGGAKPGEMDMSTLGNPGKFSYCIAENEEVSDWTPLHVQQGFKPEQSTVTLFAAEPPHGVSEHYARDGKTILKTLSRSLATVWNYRMCMLFEAFVLLCPEHVKTLQRDGFTKESAREFLFENTGVPIKEFSGDAGEGSQLTKLYQEVTIDGETCYRKFASPEQIRIVVTGGTAGKFSAIVGSWAAGPRGSQVVTYPI